MCGGSKNLTNPKEEYKNREVLTTEEIDAMIQAADLIPEEYFRLRAKCLLAILKKFGKRRSEIARLGITDLQQVGNDLEFTFHLSKKHKRGLFQFMQFCQKKGDPAILEKPLPEIKHAWREWQQTQEGHTIKNSESLQSISIDDKYTPHILNYTSYLKQKHPEAKFLFPSGMPVFGENYVLFPDVHLSGSQFLRIIKPLNNSAWLHLFRESKGAEIAKALGRNLNSVYEVKDSLDLENEATAFRYVRRYAAKKQNIET
jgi:integrase